MKKIVINNNINLYLHNTSYFKTNYLAITLSAPLKRETITSNSLIPLVLRRGSVNYPTMQDISVKLEEMYGASFDANADKIGDLNVIQFMMDMISDNYSLDDKSIIKDGINLINDIILNPALENGAFKKEYVEQEKDTLKEMIASKINDKGTYASERTVEEMYKGEPFGLYKFGYIEDLDNIDEVNLYKQYIELLKTSRINIYVSGDFDENEVIDLFRNAYQKLDVKVGTDDYKANINQPTSSDPIEITEKQNVMQGKLVFGYKLESTNLVDDFYKMQVYSAILGGTASSKLFNNVREKKSLAYTIRSQYLKHKGALFVSAGIELKNYEIAKECIFKEINDMVIGEITDEELNSAKVNLITLFKSFNDSQAALIGWNVGQLQLGGDTDLDVVINKIEAITKEDVVEVAQRLKLAITYYLTNNS